MKDKSIFEKARMNAVLIPAACFIASAALILAVIFAAAYFGGFTRLSDRDDASGAEFRQPDAPEYDYGIETVNEDPEARLEIYVLMFTASDNGAVDYKFNIVNESGAAATVKDARCMIYSKGQCVRSGTLASGIRLNGHSYKEISGHADAEGADTVIFYVSWRDDNGASADTYKVCEKKLK